MNDNFLSQLIDFMLYFSFPSCLQAIYFYYAVLYTEKQYLAIRKHANMVHIAEFVRQRSPDIFALPVEVHKKLAHALMIGCVDNGHIGAIVGRSDEPDLEKSF